MFTCLHHPFTIFPLPEKSPMFFHHFEYLAESRFIFIWKKAPWISETGTANHKSIKILLGDFAISIVGMYHLLFAISIRKDITIADNRNTNMLLEFIDSSEVSFAGECLLIGPSMDTDEICPRIFESFHKINQEGTIFPPEACFYRNGDFHCFCHLFYNTKSGVTIDHERRSMPAFDDFLGRTSHIDINTGNTISLNDFCSFTKHLRILSENLDDEWILSLCVCECFFLEFFWVHQSIRWIEFWEYYGMRCCFFDDLTVGTITIPIHWCECGNGSRGGKWFPKIFVHAHPYIQNREKIQSFLYI